MCWCVCRRRYVGDNSLKMADGAFGTKPDLIPYFPPTREDKMTPKHVDIDVQGTDMFGACFSESAKLVSVEDWKISVFMWRPVAEGARVELNCNKESYSFKGKIVKITTHLNGAQTVQVKIHLPISETLSGDN